MNKMILNRKATSTLEEELERFEPREEIAWKNNYLRK